jgi:hypothetical protein
MHSKILPILATGTEYYTTDKETSEFAAVLLQVRLWVRQFQIAIKY